jgi:segregation and condensation protein A
LHAPRVSIREQAAEVISMLRKSTKLSFRDLIGSVKDRGVVVARFLAVLELYRLSAISFEQISPLGDLQLTWRAENFDDEQLATLGADYDS